MLRGHKYVIYFILIVGYLFMCCVVMCAVSLTGMSIGQSSARQSLVTQCRNTVDIFWFLCFTKRNTSKANRPIWLFPFSKTVVWGSFSQLTQRGKLDSIIEKKRQRNCTSAQSHRSVFNFGFELPKEKVIAKVIIGVSRGCGIAVVH